MINVCNVPRQIDDINMEASHMKGCQNLRAFWGLQIIVGGDGGGGRGGREAGGRSVSFGECRRTMDFIVFFLFRGIVLVWVGSVMYPNCY